jgi:hypothetical protein
MNWSKQTEVEEEVSSGQEPETHHLYLGDRGELALETRRVLVQLLAGPSIDGKRHVKLWPVLLRDEAMIRRRLAELFFELVIDVDTKVAFTRQADTGDLEVPLLLRRTQLTFMDSVVLLFLREKLIQADSHGDRAVVSKEEMTEFIMLYEPNNQTDHAGFGKRVHASIEKLRKHNIIHKIRASVDRFEISPTLKLLFSAEKIQALTKLYQRMQHGEMPVQLTEPESHQEGES